MAKKQVISEPLNDFEESIKNYGDKIEHIDSFTEAIRRFPGMYIGSKGPAGWKACIREIFQNSVDEMIRKESPCHYVKITFNEQTQGAIIEDTGRGIPHGQIITIYASQHTSSNYTKKKGEYTSGVHGVGSGVAMALSKTFDIKSYVLGRAKHVHFDSGNVWDKGELDIPCPAGRQGTTITMEPDLSVLEDIHLTCEDILDLVLKVYPLVNIGDQIDFVGIDINGKVKYHEELVNKDGIITSLMMRTRKPIVTPIHFQDDTGEMKAEVAFTYDADALTEMEDIVSYANFTPTTGGTHVDGFMEAVCNYFRNYMNKIYLGEKSKISVINNDVKTGLKVVIAAAHLNPVFAGQFKGLLSNDDMHKYIKELTTKSLEEWAKTSPGDLQKVCKCIKEIAEIRSKSDDSKIKLSNNYEASALTGKPKKYVAPSGNKNLELIIVEGDSALGSARNSRDAKVQGIFPIRGKIPNAYKTSRATFLANQEIASIITIIGGGYGKNFELDKVKFDKIIFLADADPDGAHIDTLLLRFFLMYLPELISAGKVYRAVPPLFGIKSKGGNKYFTTKLDFTKYVQNLFAHTYTLADSTGRKLSNAETTNLFFKNIDYKDQMEFVASTFAIDPDLLETVLYYLSNYVEFGDSASVASMAAKAKVAAASKKSTTTKKTSTSKSTASKATAEKKTATKVKATVSKKVDEDEEDGINFDEIPVTEGSVSTSVSYYFKPSFSEKALRSELKKQYRFVDIVENNGVIRIEGLVNSKYQYVFINDKFISACMPLLTMIRQNTDLFYQVNGQPVSIYTLMCKFDEMIPSGLTRYKGLGEQNPEQLGVSALRPDGDRTLIRYTIESAKEEIETLRRIDSSMASLLREVKITKADIE